LLSLTVEPGGAGRPGLTIFDMDETLLHTYSEVKVVKHNKVVKVLNNQEFNTYKLEHGETFDFSDFSDARKFRATSRPIRSMLAKAKAILANIKKRPGSKMIILTARSNFDDRDIFLSVFRSFNFDIDSVRVERAGNLSSGSVFKNKEIIIREYLAKTDYAVVRMYDDALGNLEMLLDLQNDYPDTRFEAYLVNSGGTVRRYRR